MDSEGVVRKICTFLNLRFESTMLDFHRYLLLTFDLDREPWKAKCTKALDPGNAMKWISDMPRHDIKIVEIITAKDLHAKGYRVINERLGLYIFSKMLQEFFLNIGSLFKEIKAAIVKYKQHFF